jgi:group I intron endonuclease
MTVQVKPSSFEVQAMTYGIYCIEHVASGRKYVGKSKHIEQRIREHIKTSVPSSATWAKTFLAAAFRKYGWSSFRWWVIEEVTGDAALLAEKELHWIDKLGAFEQGFNTKRESAGVTEFAQEVKDKIAASLRGRPLPQAMIDYHKLPKQGEANAFYGKSHTPETKRVLQAASKANWQDPEFRIKMVGRPHGRGNKGKKATAETRAKQSAAKKGKPPPNVGVKYAGDTLDRMRVGYAKRSTMQAARKLRGVDTVDIYL